MKESQRVIQSDGSGELRRSAADRLPRHNHTIAKEIDEETTHPHPQRIAPPARTDQAKMFNHDNHKHATRVRSSARASPTPGSTTRRRARHEQTTMDQRFVGDLSQNKTPLEIDVSIHGPRIQIAARARGRKEHKISANEPRIHECYKLNSTTVSTPFNTIFAWVQNLPHTVVHPGS